ncbi:MAG: hypothetical protein RQ743_08260 [Bacteroidales bacterium]|nr:hypothetical protein [Bacteroidales bacterium]
MEKKISVIPIEISLACQDWAWKNNRNQLSDAPDTTHYEIIQYELAARIAAYCYIGHFSKYIRLEAMHVSATSITCPLFGSSILNKNLSQANSSTKKVQI